MGENVVVFDEKSSAQQQLMRLLCQLLHVKPEELPQLAQRLCAVEKMSARCDQIARLVGRTCCVGNVMYSQLTLDGYSDKSKVLMSEIVKDFGPGFVNSYPVQPGSSIRLTHLARPGFLPDQITLSLALANNGNNYMDIRVQLYVVPSNGSATDPGRPIGDPLEGNDFLELDGRRIVVSFPTYRGEPIIIGSSERLAATVSHRGGVNAINSASLAVRYDNEAFFTGCCSNCGRGESCSCSVPKSLPSPG